MFNCLLVKHEELRDSEFISEAVTTQRAGLEGQVVEVVLGEEKHGNRGAESKTDLYRGGRYEYCNELSNEQKVTLRLLEDYVNCPYVDGAPCDNFGSFVEGQWKRVIRSFEMRQADKVDVDKLSLELELIKTQLNQAPKVTSNIQARWKEVRLLEDQNEAGEPTGEQVRNSILSKLVEKNEVPATVRNDSRDHCFFSWFFDNILQPIFRFFMNILKFVKTFAIWIFGS